jgi:carbonic anhydrase
VQAVADTNARLAVAMLLDRSVVLSELVDAGELKIVAAMHDVHNGKVAVFG